MDMTERMREKLYNHQTEVVWPRQVGESFDQYMERLDRHEFRQNDPNLFPTDCYLMDKADKKRSRKRGKIIYERYKNATHFQ